MPKTSTSPADEFDDVEDILEQLKLARQSIAALLNENGIPDPIAIVAMGQLTKDLKKRNSR
jgi:hypothetical protein